MFVTGVCFQSPFPSTLLPLSWVPASHHGAVRCQSPPVSPCPAAACDGGAEELTLSEEGCVCVCVSILISATSLPALVPRQRDVLASSTLPSDGSDAHRRGARLPGSSPRLAPLQTPRGQRWHSPAPLGDPVLPGSGGQPLPSSAGRESKEGRRERKKGGGRKVISAAAYSHSPLLQRPTCAKTPSQTNPCRQRAAAARVTPTHHWELPSTPRNPPRPPQNPSSPRSPGLLQLWSC